MLEGCVTWPQSEAERYRELGAWTGEVLGDLTRDVASDAPDRIALVDGSRRISYGALDARAQRLACGLTDSGSTPAIGSWSAWRTRSSSSS